MKDNKKINNEGCCQLFFLITHCNLRKSCFIQAKELVKMKETLKKPDELNKTPNAGIIKDSYVHQGSLKSILQITL